MSALPAARVGDEIAHTCAFAGALIGLGAGLLIGGAIAATVLTGGAAAPVAAMAIGGAIAAGGGGGMAGQYIGESIMGDPCGAIAEGSPDVFINDMAAAHSTLSVVLCSKHGPPPQFEATGSSSVFINGQPAGRESEKTTCSAIIQKGSENVFIGGESQQTLAMTPEVPKALSVTMQAMMWGGTALATGGVAAGYGLFAAAGTLVGGMGGGYLGSLGGGWAAEKLGFGETGQRVGEVLGGLGGGILGGAKGFRGGQALGNRVITTPKTPAQGFARGGLPGRQQVIRNQQTVRTAAESRAANLRETLSKRQQPRATSAAINQRTGDIYYGNSGVKPSKIHPDLRSRMPDPSLERWPVNNCAEFEAANNALWGGASMDDLMIHTVKVKDGIAFPRCANCLETTNGAAVTSD